MIKIHFRNRNRKAKEEVNCFMDTSSTCSLILTVYAEERNLIWTSVIVTIRTVKGQQTRNTKLYVIELETAKGQ